MAKNKANDKQHPEVKPKLFDNYSHSSSMLSFKNNRTYSKKQAKKQACIYSWDYINNHHENEDEKEK